MGDSGDKECHIVEDVPNKKHYKVFNKDNPDAVQERLYQYEPSEQKDPDQTKNNDPEKHNKVFSNDPNASKIVQEEMKHEALHNYPTPRRKYTHVSKPTKKHYKSFKIIQEETVNEASHNDPKVRITNYKVYSNVSKPLKKHEAFNVDEPNNSKFVKEKTIHETYAYVPKPTKNQYKAFKIVQEEIVNKPLRDDHKALYSNVLKPTKNHEALNEPNIPKISQEETIHETHNHHKPRRNNRNSKRTKNCYEAFPNLFEINISVLKSSSKRKTKKKQASHTNVPNPKKKKFVSFNRVDPNTFKILKEKKYEALPNDPILTKNNYNAPKPTKKRRTFNKNPHVSTIAQEMHKELFQKPIYTDNPKCVKNSSKTAQSPTKNKKKQKKVPKLTKNNYKAVAKGANSSKKAFAEKLYEAWFNDDELDEPQDDPIYETSYISYPKPTKKTHKIMFTNNVDQRKNNKSFNKDDPIASKIAQEERIYEALHSDPKPAKKYYKPDYVKMALDDYFNEIVFIDYH